MNDENEGSKPAFQSDKSEFSDLTMRDWFATHSPLYTDLNSKALDRVPGEKTMSQLAALARLQYLYADAMLEARKKKA